MNANLICRNIHHAPEGHGSVLVAAAAEIKADLISRFDQETLTKARADLASHGIALGGPLRPVAAKDRADNKCGGLRAPVKIVALDDLGAEHILVAREVENFDLSCGSTLCLLFVANAPETLAWLCGKHIKLEEIVGLDGFGGDRAAGAQWKSEPAATGVPK